MPIVTSIKPQKNGKRVNIYLDGKFGFGIDLESFVGAGLKVEQELSEEQLTQIITKAEFAKTLGNLLRFATLRPRSKKEIADWFYRKKVAQSLHPKLFGRLKRLELVNDERFAAWWVEQRAAFRPRSRRQLTYELRQKGIDSKLTEETMARTKIDEVELCSKLIAKNESKWKGLTGKEKQRKIWEYLGRKGFAWAAIQKATKGMI